MQNKAASPDQEDDTALEKGLFLPVPSQVNKDPVSLTPSGLHPAIYIAVWIVLSSSVILFNKWILGKGGEFPYPITLTAWHLTFSTIVTQIMARYTAILDSRKKVPMTVGVYARKIVPIGVMFSMSLICSNQAYLYLSVSFIQMLKATTPIAVLLASWAMRVESVSLRTLYQVSAIVVGVVVASVGEIQFNITGFTFQVGGIVFEAIRLVMVQQILSGDDFKMDPLVSLYYFAPVCAVMNAVVALVTESSRLSWAGVWHVGILTLVANAACAFMLNVAVVFLIGKTSSLVMTLSGVLKDILLVAASLLVFGDPVSGIQALGYSIALCGLIYYKLGKAELEEHFLRARRAVLGS